jgi:hypothetical protein
VTKVTEIRAGKIIFRTSGATSRCKEDITAAHEPAFYEEDFLIFNSVAKDKLTNIILQDTAMVPDSK